MWRPTSDHRPPTGRGQAEAANQQSELNPMVPIPYPSKDSPASSRAGNWAGTAGRCGATHTRSVATARDMGASWLRAAESPFAEIAGRAGRDDVIPPGHAALGARNDVVEGQVAAVTAILARELVTKKNVEPCECGIARGSDIAFQRNDAGQPHRKGRAFDLALVFRNDVDPVKEHGFDGVLPAPQR